MFPPGRGNDNLVVGEIYMISLFGTNEMLTAEGVELRLRGYQEGNREQMWVCEKNSDNRYGMRNRQTGRLLGQRDNNRFACAVYDHLEWEWLAFTRDSLGGYSITVSPASGDKLGPLQRINPNDEHLMVGEVGTQFGLHQLKDPVLRRFEWVVPNRLARSSAPYYDGEDSDESINQTSIEFLQNYSIQNIISLNSVEISPRERGRLRAAKISYSHIKALECTGLTQEQFDKIWTAYDKAGVTVVYCGYGDGRTGMAISALQLFEGRTLSDLDYRANGVQCRSQIEALNALSERIHGVENLSDPPDTSDPQPPPYAAPEKDKS
ncbi:hypothetical protein C7212DRAFT_342264 [Tuber magnatum]|uniref:Tyrosine specific protein phosphatases domain-containing protein n=1 Tax=Tuber magnatum TaxID=42249 RepID=A0A317SSA7_9PEZI|nr:hypothetical protein C7212DRAFT_342264 [Tuber magnatum]